MGFLDNVLSSLKTGSRNISNTIRTPLDTAHNKLKGKLDPQKNVNKVVNKLNPNNNPGGFKCKKKK